MKHIKPNEISTQEVYSLLTSTVHPRPIALVATLSENGTHNLSPFSFFNAFGANPPMIGFSPTSRVRDGSHKDTYHNLMRTKECTVQVVTYDMVNQVNLASTEYETGIDEFVKSGLTPLASEIVSPPRVKESPIQMECRLDQVVHLGNNNGSGNLMICEVLRFHVDETVLDNGIINPDLLDLVGRNGMNFYTRAKGDALFELKKPSSRNSVGYDRLPQHVLYSSVFTGNDLGRLGTIEKIPPMDEAKQLALDICNQYVLDNETNLVHLFERAMSQKAYQMMLAIALKLKEDNHFNANQMIEKAAKIAIELDNINFAWKCALLAA